MEIKINHDFAINVPKFTDELQDLLALNALNFHGMHLTKVDYTTISQEIVNSNNTNWDKAIALAIVNVRLIYHKIYEKKFFVLAHRITYIVEILATSSIPKIIENIQNGKHVNLSTYIANSVVYSLNKRSDTLTGTYSKLQRLSVREEKLQEWTIWHDAVVEYRRVYGKIPAKNEYDSILQRLDHQIEHLKKSNSSDDLQKYFIKEKQLLTKIQNGYKFTKISSDYVLMSDLVLLPTEELTEAIDQRSYVSDITCHLDNQEMEESLDFCLDTLTAREETILRQRYLTPHVNMKNCTIQDGATMSKIARMFGVDISRIKQIHDKAMKKLNHESRLESIRPYHYQEGYKYQMYLVHDEHNQLPANWKTY